MQDMRNIGLNVIELIQFLFATEKDQNLYLNQESLVEELLMEHRFDPSEVASVMAWFEPLINNSRFLDINPESIRSISPWEERYVPREIIEQIFEGERTHSISRNDREILLDRLAELALDWQVEPEDMQPILEGLIYHLQNYQPEQSGLTIPASPYYFANNATVH